MQSPEVQHQRRRHAEIDEIGKAVELGAETRRALEHAGNPAVDAVEQGGKYDCCDGPLELVLDRQTNRG